MVPKQWREYPCEDYFSSPLAVGGYWSESGQLWLIEPAERVEEDTEAEFLQVGRPSCSFSTVGCLAIFPCKPHSNRVFEHRRITTCHHLPSTSASVEFTASQS